ncbi:hypothetical protein [Pseudoduganella umbonata]|uniref:Uncharacterized protein n=1 Tax=Pseudoduganella umbonata TaxID=864828 RepID=A0A4P8HLD3_9BURK|nr:hypothetical protein [Pseudoduganella umbonata]MBB3221686.1 hypothetical protein [Pseudoduganella umbonata]QCP09090.1 hypothetical protein FCL38_00535 [Pseudoduganella umbonata]
MNSRKDVLTAQHLQVGLVYKEMLGTSEAEAYLRSVGIAPHLINRLLYSDDHRQIQQTTTGRPNDRNDAGQ